MFVIAGCKLKLRAPEAILALSSAPLSYCFQREMALKQFSALSEVSKSGLANFAIERKKLLNDISSF